MASVGRRTDGRPGYTARWRDESGRQCKRSFRRKTDADRFAAEVEHSLNTGGYVDPAAGRVLFREYAEAWRAIQPHRPNTARSVGFAFKNHAYPVIGDRPLSAIRPSEVQAFVTGLSARLAPGSVRTAFAHVRSVFRAAVRDRKIGSDPSVGVKLPERPPYPEIVPLSVEEVQRLADAAPLEFQALIAAGAGSGLRQGELFGLQVRDVDFLRRTLKVERQIQMTGVGPPKTRSSRRTVPVGQVVLVALAEHLRQYPAADEEFVFTDYDGEPLDREKFKNVWYRLRAAAGLPKVGMHDLRHHYASLLIAGGQSAKVVAARLGHANAELTWNVYTHLWPEDEDRSRQVIDEAYKIQPDVPRMRPAGGSSA